MIDKLNQQYLSAAQEFARMVVAELGDEVDSIVLYGSVARGEATRYSDIDILLISRDPDAIRKRVSKIRSKFDQESDYRFLIPVTHLSDERLYWLRKNGAPFLTEVMRDGAILYDDGTLARILENTARTG